ncbi:hypothetical protein AAZX31_05G109100 [Glycine max]
MKLSYIMLSWKQTINLFSWAMTQLGRLARHLRVCWLKSISFGDLLCSSMEMVKA